MYLSSQQHPTPPHLYTYPVVVGAWLAWRWKKRARHPEKNAIMRRLEYGSEEIKNARVVMSLKFFHVKHACMVCVCEWESETERERNWCFRGGFCCPFSSLFIMVNFSFLLPCDTWFCSIASESPLCCCLPLYQAWFCCLFFLPLTGCCSRERIVCLFSLRVAGDWSPDLVSWGWALSHTGIRQPVMKVFVFSLSEAIVTGRFLEFLSLSYYWLNHNICLLLSWTQHLQNKAACPHCLKKSHYKGNLIF